MTFHHCLMDGSTATLGTGSWTGKIYRVHSIDMTDGNVLYFDLIVGERGDAGVIEESLKMDGVVEEA